MEPEGLPQLSCERCKRRKIRCDKRNPCGACMKSGISCDTVQRARLPRGRSAKVQKDALENRVTRLESLLKKFQNVDGMKSIALGLGGSDEALSSESGNGSGEFVAPEFWSALSQEIAGLRGTLESPDEDLDSREASAGADASPDPSTNTRTILFKLSHPLGAQISPILNPWPSREIRTILLTLYHERVDCLYKILHWPTVLADIERIGTKPKSIVALELSIYLLAICSISDNEASELGLGDRTDLAQRYLLATEKAISDADLMQHPNITSLQAFSLYLLGLRKCHNSAISWTLLAVAVRVGTALRLGQEDPRKFSPFELQLRRRLWYFLAIVDTYGCFDRGTGPMIFPEDLGPRPLELNDRGISLSSVSLTPSPGFNEMSFFCLVSKAMVCHKTMLNVADTTEAGWTAKLNLVAEFEEFVTENYLNPGEEARPLERYAERFGHTVIASLNLLLRRPPYKTRWTLVPPSDTLDVMNLSKKVLDEELYKESPEFSQWAWKSWVPWHALAILLAELCSRPRGENTDAAYLTAVKSFRRYARVVADSDSGMLWKPIARLMRRVQQVMESHSNTPESMETPRSLVAVFEKSTDQPTSLNTSGNSLEPTRSMYLDPWIDNNGLSMDLSYMDSGNGIHDLGVTILEDPQLNWSLFMDDVNMDYSLNFLEGNQL